MVIVITGASRGLGRSIAIQFASDKRSHLFLLTARDTEKLKELSKELQEISPSSTIKTYSCDLYARESVRELAEWIHQQSPDVDILVNNAGQFYPGSVHDEAEGVLEDLMAVNLFSAYHLTRALLPPMIERKSGHIFNICSIAALQAYPNGGAYSITKTALSGFSKNLREEMKPFNIKVTAVYPGAAYTDSWAAAGVNPDRLMEAEDISKLVYACSMLSDKACVEEILVRPQLGDL